MGCDRRGETQQMPVNVGFRSSSKTYAVNVGFRSSTQPTYFRIFMHNLRSQCWVSFFNPTYVFSYFYAKFTQSMLGFVPQPNLRYSVSLLISSFILDTSPEETLREQPFSTS
ncbi:hypothetical protein [Scytonema sp. NUACC21]